MSRYSVYVLPAAWKQISDLPGNVRERVRRAVDELGSNPRPARSRRLHAPGFEPELYRLRLDRWRIVYAVSDQERTIDILAVRKRPPYDYGDLEALIAEMR